jgi:hypothetical protein
MALQRRRRGLSPAQAEACPTFLSRLLDEVRRKMIGMTGLEHSSESMEYLMRQ